MSLFSLRSYFWAFSLIFDARRWFCLIKKNPRRKFTTILRHTYVLICIYVHIMKQFLGFHTHTLFPAGYCSKTGSDHSRALLLLELCQEIHCNALCTLLFLFWGTLKGYVKIEAVWPLWQQRSTALWPTKVYSVILSEYKGIIVWRSWQIYQTTYKPSLYYTRWAVISAWRVGMNIYCIFAAMFLSPWKKQEVTNEQKLWGRLVARY